MPPRFRTSLKPTILIGVLAVGAVAAVGTINVAAVGAPPGTQGYARWNSALDRLGDRLPVVAAAYGLNPGELRQLLLDDDSLAVDGADQLAYFDVLAPGEASAGPASDGLQAAPPVTGPEFQLASLPGAAKTIYLDFDGHTTTGTTWNAAYGITDIESPPYSIDGDFDSWSSAELQVISDTWKVVSEDFAPWNVNVTTIDPGTEALRRSGNGDDQWGARVVITDDTFANCGCGGHAYVGAFDDVQDEPTFVYNSTFTGVSEATSHEVGHMLGLRHDGSGTTTYYRGHDTAGTPGWAPIMGASYYEPVTQWSRQEYFGANNTGEDDLAIISSLGNGNNFGLRADDHGDTPATATALLGDTPSNSGLIGTRSDVDVFWFSTDGGEVSFSASNAAVGPNLDIELTLRDSAGSVVAFDNVADGLDAAVAANLAAGTYTVEVDGVGVGTPGSNPPSGYSDYASLGRYTLAGTITGSSPPDTTPPAAPADLVGIEVDGMAQLSWTPNTEPDLSSYVVRRAPSASGPFSDIATVAAGAAAYVDASAATGSNAYAVVAVDTTGNQSAESNTVEVTIPVVLTSTATGETPVSGAVSGSYLATTLIDGSSQTISEVDSGGKPSKRHDQAEHRWAIPASQGNQRLTIVASVLDGGDADDGFVFEWSANGTAWVPVATVHAGTSLNDSFDIGIRTGTVQVRVTDTDRTRGERLHDSVAVDFLQIDGDGDMTPVDPTNVFVSISVSKQSVGKGQQQGVATVQVNDDQGRPVAGADVEIRFTGTFVETITVPTGPTGSATAVTTASARKPDVSACVADLSDVGLEYLPGDEACPPWIS